MLLRRRVTLGGRIAEFHASAAAGADQRTAHDRQLWHDVPNHKPDLYRVLKVPAKATKAEIRKAYLALAKTYHPDVSDGPHHDGLFRTIAEAYEVLSDEAKRKAYDDSRLPRDATGNPPAAASAYETEDKPSRPARRRTRADYKRKNEPWNVSSGATYTRADHETAYNDAVYGAAQRIRMERHEQGEARRAHRTRLHVPTQQESFRNVVATPLAILLIMLLNIALMTRVVLKPRESA